MSITYRQRYGMRLPSLDEQRKVVEEMLAVQQKTHQAKDGNFKRCQIKVRVVAGPSTAYIAYYIG